MDMKSVFLFPLLLVLYPPVQLPPSPEEEKVDKKKFHPPSCGEKGGGKRKFFLPSLSGGDVRGKEEEGKKEKVVLRDC